MTMKDDTVISEKERALRQLLDELEKGRSSGETEGWLTPEEVKNTLWKSRFPFYHFADVGKMIPGEPPAEMQAVFLCLYRNHNHRHSRWFSFTTSVFAALSGCKNSKCGHQTLHGVI